MKKPVKILLIDPHPIVARMLCSMAQETEAIEVVRVRSVEEAESVASCWPFDMTLLSLGTEEVANISAFVRAQKISMGRPTMVLCGPASREAAEVALELGAEGVLDRTNLAPGEISRVVRFAMRSQGLAVAA